MCLSPSLPSWTTFTIELEAVSTGTYGGQLSLPTNDTDENPFNFTLAGNVAESDPPGDDFTGAQLLNFTPGVEQELSETIGNGIYPNSDVDL